MSDLSLQLQQAASQLSVSSYFDTALFQREMETLFKRGPRYAGQGGPAGTLLGAPHFAEDPCLNLNNYPLQEWNGMLFEKNGVDVAKELANMGPRAELDFSGMVLDHIELHQCNYNWKTFIEVYL